MSGGHYNNAEFSLINIAEQIEEDIRNNDNIGMSPKVVECMDDLAMRIKDLHSLIIAADKLYEYDISEARFLQIYKSRIKL